MRALLSFVVLLIIVVHGYLYIRYATVDPCEAAIVRIQEDAAARGDILNLFGATAIDAAGLHRQFAREQGVPACYRIALFGYSNSDLARPHR